MNEGMALNDLIKLLEDMVSKANAEGRTLKDCENPELCFISEACTQLRKLDVLQKILGENTNPEYLRRVVEQDKNGDVAITQCRHKLVPLRLGYICSDSLGTRVEQVQLGISEGADLKYCIKCGTVFVDKPKDVAYD